MTEFWKSNAHYWCDVCKVWMLDKLAIRQIHEKGIKHQENVAKKLRAMRQGAETQKREEAQTEAVLKSVEKQAAEQYARDQAAAEQSLAAIHGTWEPDEGTGYLYNKAQRYYYDKATSMYYGGKSPTWTAEPAMPAAARYGAEPPPAADAKTVSAARQTSGAAKPRMPRQAISQQVGGYQMPTTGVIGGLAGVGGAASVSQSQQAGTKRPREQPGSGKAASKAVSKEEAAALARREAARARVQQRTMQQFGLG